MNTLQQNLDRHRIFNPRYQCYQIISLQLAKVQHFEHFHAKSIEHLQCHGES